MVDPGFSSIVICSSMLLVRALVAATAAMNISDSSKGRELQALKDFGWPYMYSTDHCEWKDIACDDGRHVVEISLQGHALGLRGLDVLDLLAFPHLTKLQLTQCELSESIPTEIGHLSKLTYLNLSRNVLSSPLPLSLANLTQLKVLDISYNLDIEGAIPPEIGSLSKLTHLILSRNRLSGELPLSLANLTDLQVFNISYNEIYGVFEAGIEKLPSIDTIDLSWNSISGQIPPQFGNVANAKYLKIDLSHNYLTGSVPKSLSYLNEIDLSYNNLEGRIPSRVRDKFREKSFIGNPELGPRKHPGVLYIGIGVGGFFVCSVFIGILLKCCKKGKNALSPTCNFKHGNIFKIWNYDGKLAYEDIIVATADFDLRYCIGTGGYGSVYRAKLPCGRTVAVKKLHRFEGDNPNYDMCFRNEAEVLSQIRHRNIVKLFGFCLHKRCMFLIYDYMERGSLFCVLNDAEEAVELNWMKRVNVVKGIANALCYMHHDCRPPILHRDISSSNILLDSKLEAYVYLISALLDCWILIHLIRL